MSSFLAQTTCSAPDGPIVTFNHKIASLSMRDGIIRVAEVEKHDLTDLDRLLEAGLEFYLEELSMCGSFKFDTEVRMAKGVCTCGREFESPKCH